MPDQIQKVTATRTRSPKQRIRLSPRAKQVLQRFHEGHDIDLTGLGLGAGILLAKVSLAIRRGEAIVAADDEVDVPLLA